MARRTAVMAGREPSRPCRRACPRCHAFVPSLHRATRFWCAACACRPWAGWWLEGAAPGGGCRCRARGWRGMEVACCRCRCAGIAWRAVPWTGPHVRGFAQGPQRCQLMDWPMAGRGSPARPLRAPVVLWLRDSRWPRAGPWGTRRLSAAPAACPASSRGWHVAARAVLRRRFLVQSWSPVRAAAMVDLARTCAGGRTWGLPACSRLSSLRRLRHWCCFRARPAGFVACRGYRRAPARKWLACGPCARAASTRPRAGPWLACGARGKKKTVDGKVDGP
ncbi:hypothetical protein L613_002600000140 [Pseudoxanthomonas taiwanensis J19]|uniref:Uncharacterized protein n=1 Tax=Pseudoxanthomonas taiwanensis J19 TaxID=935569 RepID=A0A562DLJ4_9GAMM|nr:hypothetical protein L613_002600000140 [Pseudoxanthomonas taiwanensis J19]